MAMLAAGPECPGCGSIGPHDITRLEVEARTPVGMVLHCGKCEKVWYEKLGHN